MTARTAGGGYFQARRRFLSLERLEPAWKQTAMSAETKTRQPVASLDQFVAGDLLFFAGADPLSREIAWRTASWRQVFFGQRFSHVEIVADLNDPTSGEIRPLVVGSTTLCGTPCLWQGCEVEGVQVHEPQSRIDSYNGSVWRFRLVDPLTLDESARLTQFCRETIGEPYDRVRAGLLAIGNLRGFLHCPPTLHEWFCSEHAGTALKRCNRIGQDNNCERLSPNGLAALLIDAGNVWPLGERSQSRRLK